MNSLRFFGAAVRALCSSLSGIRLFLLAAIAFVPAGLFAQWSLPSSAVASSTNFYSISWSGYVSGNASVILSVKAPASTTWEDCGGGFGSNSQVTVSGYRPFPVAGIWSVKVRYGDGAVEINSTTFSVAPNTIPTTFTFGNLSHSYDGNTKTATVSRTPSNATYTSSLTAGPAPGSYTVTATATAPYTGSSSATLTIAKAGQAVVFGNPGPQVYGFPVTLGGYATSGLPVTYSVVAGSATVSGNVVTATAQGNVTIRASQGGNAYFYAADSIDNTFLFRNTAPVVRNLTVTRPDGTAVGAGAQGEPAIYLGEPVLVTGTIHDDDGNLTVHGLSVSYAVAPWTPLVDTTPANRTDSVKSATYTPTQAGRWDFNTNGTDGLIWPTGLSKTLWVYGNTNNASVSSYSIKGVANATAVAVAPGQTFPVSITLRNTGDRPWTTDAHPHKLVALLAGWGAGTVALPVPTVFPNAEATFVFNVTAPATAATFAPQWQMAEYFNASPTLFGSLVSASVLVAPLPTATISASAHSGLENTANGGGTIVTYVGDPISITTAASSSGWLSEHNIFVYSGTTTPVNNTMIAGGVLPASAGLTSNSCTSTWTPTAPGTYTIYTEAFTGLTAGNRANGTSGYPGLYDGAANKRITVQVRRSPTLSLQVLNASKQPIALDGNGRAPLEAGAQFFVRVAGSNPDGVFGRLYLRYQPNGGTTVSVDVAATGATATNDFGPYTVNQTGTCAVWAHASDDHCAGWGSVTPWDGNKLGWGTLGSNGAQVSDTTPPSVPNGLNAPTASIGSTSFTLNWNSSSDNVAVAGYKVYRDGILAGTPTTNSLVVTGLTLDTTYNMQVLAFDAAGKESALSTPVYPVTTILEPTGDYDNDGMTNKWESDNGLNPKNVGDALTDLDADGWTNVAEFKRGTNPKSYDANPSYPGQPGNLLPPRRDVDQAGGPVVGSTVGSLSVGKTGEASYSIPLWVVPGTSGMEPKLSLNYSSQGGPGVAGYGWSLGGLSAISRGPLTKLVDGQIKAVGLTAADAYYMDGQRLIVVNGTNGAASSEYRTQMESFTKVVVQTATSAGPQWFKAWTKAGLCIEFGNPATPNSRVVSDQVANAVLSWTVNKITDIAGNYMTFSYDWDATTREQRLSRIDYTGNTAAGLVTFAAVEFTYEDRPDQRLGYSAGSKSSQIKRLKEIIARGPDGIAKRYTLGYITQPLTDFSLLDSLTEADAAGRAYNPLRFTYAQHNAANMQWVSDYRFTPPKAISSKRNGADVGTGFVDLNGDGWTDIAGYRLFGGGSFDFKGIWLGSPTGWVEQPANSPWQLPNPLAREGDGDQGGRFVDLNGDGLVDFVWSLRDKTSKGAYLNTGSGWQVAPQWNPPDYFVYSQTKTGAAQFTDMNGDGLPDMVVARYGVDNNRNGVYLNTGSGWTTLQTSWALPAYLWAKDLDDTGARLVDLNGDGLPDLIQGRYNEAGAWGNNNAAQKAWLNTGSGWTQPSAGYKPQLPLAREKYPMWGAEFTDINGDGLVDFLVNHFDGRREEDNKDTYRSTYLNTGRGWVAVADDSKYTSPWVFACNNNSGSGAGARAGAALIDLNQDGLPDEIWKRAWDGDPEGSPQYGVSFMTASGFKVDNFTGDPLQLNQYFLAYEERPGVGGQFVDFNADGAPDFIWRHNGDNVPPGYSASGAYRNTTPRPNLLKTVTNGLGVKAEIIYTVLTARADDGSFTVYDQGTSVAAPTSRVGIGPMTVVQALRNETGMGGTGSDAYYDVTYRYGTLRSHPLYGSLGFRDVTVYDARTAVRQYTRNSQTYPYIGMPEYSETKQGSSILQQSTVIYATKEFTQANGKKTLMPFAASALEQTFDPSGAKLTDTTTYGDATWYDAYGNVTHLEVESRDATGALLAKVVTENTYFDTAASFTNWRLGRLSRSRVTHSRTGQTDVTRTSSFTYAESNTGMLATETIEPDAGPALKVITTRTRDSFGNVTGVTTSTTDPITGAAVNRTATTQYDTRGRFPLWTKNALAQQETYTYDQNLGLKLTLTGPNGLRTQWGYDTFGRIYYEARPDRTTTRTIHSWDAIAGWKYTIFTDTLYRVNGTDANAVDFLRDHRVGPPSQTYFDSFGRARLARGLNGDGYLVNVATTYDLYGRTVATTQPYFEGATTIYSATTEYDTYGRPSKSWMPIDDPAGTSAVLKSLTTYTYDGLHTYTKVVAPAAADGSPSGAYAKTRRKDSWTNALGQTVTVIDNYDKGASSPEYGKVTYTHDAIGNVATTTVYKENGAFYTTGFEYDNRGRKTGMSDPNMGSWDYEYDALGQLRRQTDSKGQQVTMTYDTLGRMLTRSRPETVPSIRTVTTTWTYDTAGSGGIGKLHKLATYSGSASTVNADYYVERYTYDTLGRPTAVKRIIYDENSGDDLDPDSPALTRAYSFGFVYDDSWQDADVEAGRGHGQLRYLVYPFGYKVENFYTKLGLLKEIRRADGTHTELLWQAAKGMSGRTSDEYGRALAAKLGNGLDLVWERPTAGGGVRTIHATFAGQTVRKFDYGYDGFQNVRYRGDRLRDLAGTVQLQEETFSYDALQRLKSWTITGQAAKNASYDALGNIVEKTGIGTYLYAGTGPNAVSSVAGRTFTYDANGNCLSDGERTIRWTAANQVQRIDKGANFAEFFLDAADQRVRQKSNSGTTIYVGGLFERFVSPSGSAFEHRFYVMTPTGRAVLHTEDGSSANGRDQFLVGDALGSISSVYDQYGRHIETRRYDPWGVQTKVLSSTSTLNVNSTTRGFTDHEMLENVGLIHMNGRVYDPVLGRFLSADPFVDDATTAGAYNRYAYCGNDPLGHTDPSGFFSLKDIITIVVAVVVTVVVTICTFGAGTPYTLAGFMSVLTSTAPGALTAIVAGGAAGGFAGGFTGSLLNGASLGDAFKAGILGGIAGGVTAWASAGIGGWLKANAGELGWGGEMAAAAAAHGVVGGAVSEIQGGEFRHGFYSSAASAAFSHSPVGRSLMGGGKTVGDFLRRTAVAATIGGTSSVLSGGKFSNGATTAAFQHLFNDESHMETPEEVQRHAAEIAAQNGSWIQPLANEYGDTLVLDFLDKGIAQYQDIVAVHSDAAKNLTNTNSYGDMGREVNRLWGKSFYRFGSDGKAIGVGGVSTSAAVTGILIVDQSYDMKKDAAFTVLSRSFQNISVRQHEYTHYLDKVAGRFAGGRDYALSEVRAYKSQVDLLKAARSYLTK